MVPAFSRVVIFTRNMAAMTAFYRDVLGLRAVSEEPGWVEFSSGGFGVALHEWDGEAPEGPVKLVFHTDDVAAARALLTSRGAKMDEIIRFRNIELCDGFDPDGNAFQLSSRPIVGGA